MKHTQSIRAIITSLFLALMLSSCEKADFIEAPSCSTKFTGEIITCGANRSAVYRFVTQDETNIEIQGDLFNFIGQDAVVTVTGGLLYVTQSAISENTTRNIKLTGNAGGCKEIVITISWTSTNYDNVMSGNWTVKDNDGTELAPAVQALECDSR